MSNCHRHALLKTESNIDEGVPRSLLTRPTSEQFHLVVLDRVGKIEILPINVIVHQQSQTIGEHPRAVAVVEFVTQVHRHISHRYEVALGGSVTRGIVYSNN